MTNAGVAAQGPRTLRELVQRLARHWVLMGIVFVVVLVAVALWTLLAAPRYHSTAVLRIMDQNQGMQLADQLSSMPGGDLLGLGRDELETEIGVLRSWRISSAVVDSLALTVSVVRPAGPRSDILSVEERGDPDREGELTLRRRGEGFSVTVEEPDQDEADLGTVVPGGVVEWAGYRLRLADPLPDDAPSRLRVDVVRWDEAVENLREDLDIRQEEGGSRLVQVSLTSKDREMAAAVVNTVVGEYVRYKTGIEGSESRYTVVELRAKLEEYRDQLADAEEALRSYKESHRIVDPEEQATQQVRRIAELQLQVDAADVERESLSRLLAVIEQRAEATDTTSRSSAYRQLATFPSLISNRAIQDLLMVLLELENDRSLLRVRRTEENADVRQLTLRIRELETQLHRLGTDYLESLDGQLASARETLAVLEAELEELPDQEMTYMRLLRDRTVLGEAYVLLERQLRLAEVQEAVRDEGVRVVDRGIVAHPDNPAYPRPLVNLFLGLVVAGALALGAGLTRDLWDA